GLQHADYFRRDAQPRLAATRINSSPWLHNLTMSLNLTSTLTAYGSYSRGLEDNGNAPDSTSNRGQPLPAIKSRQYDVGVSWSPNAETKLIVGYFNIKKPYAAADYTNTYRLLGDETHSGLELSLNASPLQGLTVVLGGVFTDPHIDNVGDAKEVIGKLPVSQPRNIAQLNLDYVLPFAPQASVNLSINEFSSFATTVDNRFNNSYPTIVNVGGRYKFKMRATPYTLRLIIANATNQYFWYQAGTHAFQPSHDATATLSIAADF
ncbi:MAG TPA: TonB-dependent receptor, partial [Steroidobacteraceae bacterium]|nr:TonB-dependent receptor [Steroidobacteraceae bacterium]